MPKFFDTASLKIRLTVGIATVTVLGLGGLAAWMSMQMQQMLIATHKENMRYIASRFPQDVAIYSDMIPLYQGAQRAIDNLSTVNKLIWLKNPQNQIIVKSKGLSQVKIDKNLLSIDHVSLAPEVQKLNGKYWLMCATPLKVKNQHLGQLYLAYDITHDQVMFLDLIQRLAIATIIFITIMTAIIAAYIHQAMLPLKRISKLTASISVEQLNQAQLKLEQAPTEVKELAETLDQMLVRLWTAWEHQRELLSNVSHELRTPLTIIAGYIQSILRRSNNLTEMQIEALTTAASEAERTVQLLQDLLDLARLDANRMEFKQENLLLNDLIEEVVGMAEQYGDRQITLELSEELISIKADQHRLKQVLLNLLDNAFKYSEPNTPITMKLKLQNSQAIIQIRDRGIGIPLQQQGRIFERFFRVDEARNRSGGTGLGLSIVKTLVENMGGIITLRSEPNQGSTFTLTFPVLELI